jgi:2-oxoglutarate dehydrogenase complex dehydrogenase (E1) component-like enzyme
LPVPGDDPTYTQAELDAKIAEANAALEANRNALLAEKKQTEKQLAKYKDIDPDKYAALSAAAAEAERKAAEASGDWKAREAQILDRHAKELETLGGRNKTLSAALERRLIDAEATSAIAAAKGSPKVLLPHIKSHVKVVEEDGEFVVHVVDSAATRASAMRRAPP